MNRKSSKHPHVTYGTLNSCFDLIGSHQHCIPISPPLEIEPATPECRNRTSTNVPSDTLDYVVVLSYDDWLIWHRLRVAWTGGPLVEVRFLHTGVAGSISSGGDFGMHCWWDPIRSKQLFNVSHVGVSWIF